jgi:HlyD family secretion protein
MRLNIKKVAVLIGGVAVVAVAALLVDHFAFAEPAPAFRFVTVERGDLQAVVSATGTLNAVTTVSVGTQVSGQVSALLVDFNDQVKKGQLLARIDPTLAQQGVADAQANLEKLEAQSNQAARDQGRNRELAAAGLIAPSALELGDAALLVARAGDKSARIALQKAQQNLSYTSIYAPIDGVVVERNVNLGQTVAASLSAPQLFLIANDLAHMQILAQVGESDIEQIQEDQTVSFTVQAMPGQTFAGTVQQVRLQSTTVDNVVNYTVIVALENPGRKLLPGMTARVDFLVKSAVNVLKVPNAALRYKPSEELRSQMRASPTPPAVAGPEGATTAGSSRAARAGGRSGGPGARRNQEGGSRSGRRWGTLYFVDAEGKLQVARVQTGLSDGAATEVQGPNVTEGMKVIDGLASTTAASPKPAANPLGGAQQGGGGRGRGGAF